METLIHADIFFFITTIFIVIVGTGLAVVIAYVVPILKNIRRISQIAKEEAEKLAQDIEDVRVAVKEEAGKLVHDIDTARSTLKEKGIKAKSLFDYMLALFSKKKKVIRKKKKITN